MNKEIEEVIFYIISNGFFTGSRAMGVATSDSDYDYAFNLENFDRIKKLLAAAKIKYGELESYELNDTEFGAGLYFEYKGKTYNIIGLKPSDLDCWKKAQKLFIHHGSNSNHIKDKASRKILYKRICAVYSDLLYGTTRSF